ncbi:MAG: hypothetical protein INR72_16940, partial [Williamsia herbipolensis]|nr:hypothetical protein [Williamsia herbipolensis]
MRVSRQLAPPVLAGVVIICAGTALATAPPSHASSGQAYVWVGNSTRSGGDDHSWTDARNWSPQAVPGSGDFVTVAPPSPDACGAGVDGVPAGTTLTALDLHETGAGVTLCPASLSGGDITVTGSFTWDGGSLATAVTVAAGAHGTVTATHATDRLAGGLTVDGTVDLSGLDADAPLVVARPASVTVGA